MPNRPSTSLRMPNCGSIRNIHRVAMDTKEMMWGVKTTLCVKL